MYQKNETGNRVFFHDCCRHFGSGDLTCTRRNAQNASFFHQTQAHCVSYLHQDIVHPSWARLVPSSQQSKLAKMLGFHIFSIRKNIYSNELSLYIIKALYHQTYTYEILIPYLTIISTYFMLNYNRFVNFISIVIIEVTTCMDLPMIIR